MWLRRTVTESACASLRHGTAGYMWSGAVTLVPKILPVAAVPVNMAVLLLSMLSKKQRQYFQGLLCSMQDISVTSQTWPLPHGAVWSLEHEIPRCWHPQITEWPQTCHHLDYSDVA